MSSDDNHSNEDLDEDQLNEDYSSENQQDEDQLSEMSEDSLPHQLPQDEDDDERNENFSDDDQWDEFYSQFQDQLTEYQTQWDRKYSEFQDQLAEDQIVRRNNAVFEHFYLCFPVSSVNKISVENGDKIIMPASALDSLAQLNIEYPMIFELKNLFTERTTHCGVLEFTADEGIVFLPNWMMEYMLLQEGDLVSLKSKSLAKGKFVKFQPHSKDFLDVSNPKAILETALRSYSCLTTGRTIMILYNNKKYYIDVVETKPLPAISIIETDCEVDFAPPLDYKEPEKPLPSDLSDKEAPQVIPFSGSGRRLDGKHSTQSVEQTITPILKQQQTENKTMNSNRTENKTTSSNRISGKFVFGSNANASNVETKPKSTSQESSSKKTDAPQFQAFTGKKYSLKD